MCRLQAVRLRRLSGACRHGAAPGLAGPEAHPGGRRGNLRPLNQYLLAAPLRPLSSLHYVPPPHSVRVRFSSVGGQAQGEEEGESGGPALGDPPGGCSGVPGVCLWGSGRGGGPSAAAAAAPGPPVSPPCKFSSYRRHRTAWPQPYTPQSIPSPRGLSPPTTLSPRESTPAGRP